MILHALIVGVFLAFLVGLGWLENRRAKLARAKMVALPRPAPAWIDPRFLP